MESWLQQIINALPQGPLYLTALLFVTFFESVPFIGLIMPGSTLAVLAGFLAFHGKGSFLAIALVSILGSIVGDSISYWLGSRYGSRLIRLQIFQKQHKLVKRSERFFLDHGGKSLFFARFLGPIRGITPFIAGLSKMSGRSFTLYTLISAVLWGISYPGLGYIGGQSWNQAESLSWRFALLIGALLCAVVIHGWVKRKVQQDR